MIRAQHMPTRNYLMLKFYTRSEGSRADIPGDRAQGPPSGSSCGGAASAHATAFPLHCRHHRPHSLIKLTNTTLGTGNGSLITLRSEHFVHVKIHADTLPWILPHAWIQIHIGDQPSNCGCSCTSPARSLILQAAVTLFRGMAGEPPQRSSLAPKSSTKVPG